MLYYFKCRKCQNTSGLFLESELSSKVPSCNVCQGSGGSIVDRLSSMAFFFGCMTCKGTWSYVSPGSYAQAKAARPDCPLCKTNAQVFFVPPDPTQKQKTAKRRKPGIVDPQVHDVGQELALEPKSRGTAVKRKWADEDFQPEETLFEVTPVQNDHTAEKRIKMELGYRQQKKRQSDFDLKYGKLQDKHDPMKTAQHPHRVVTFATYKNKMKSITNVVGGVTYPRSSKAGPTLVTGSRVVSVSHTWDYRELGPNSFLRRLCLLVFVRNYGSTDAMVPVEVQAMWAAGSLYLSCNNYDFSKKVYEDLTQDKTLKKFITELKLNSSDTGSHGTVGRSLPMVHTKKLPDYKRDFAANTEQSYPDYFLFRWEYVFRQLRDALECTQISKVEIVKNNGDYTRWTVGNVQAGRVYIVLPQQGQGFLKKEVHAEQLFYPILMKLDQQGLLSASQPAFIGGVKTACLTCSMVMNAAHGTLGDKLILPTDAHGHYWEASGRHVTNPTFDSNDLAMVFGKDTNSDSLVSTEFPPSPQRK
ncbi:hypothetical protein [Vitiosangium sp. GDMCC 1.1324]|uniref:hypothetical protein n=1 Tax=Vitiosangium sp. (strain GDMCC 1.1324) TaxID=2138576 RepID=UPI000D36831C|nr:hypothetical protein [Vitiosangium sp. GDMCC 1.1324]PTL76502.1 hypothetical protein DAT35_48665 [Vitiosangium sp. GDMCC 1.1324]